MRGVSDADDVDFERARPPCSPGVGGVGGGRANARFHAVDGWDGVNPSPKSFSASCRLSLLRGCWWWNPAGRVNMAAFVPADDDDEERR